MEANQRQMIDFKGKIGLTHRVSLFGPVDNCIAPANDRKTVLGSTACKGRGWRLDRFVNGIETCNLRGSPQPS